MNIFPYINGFIDNVLIKNGQYVKTGETLFIIQQRHYLAQKEMAKSNLSTAYTALKQAQMRLNCLEQTNNQNEILIAQQSFLNAQKRLRQAQTEFANAKIKYDYTLVRAPVDGIIEGISVVKSNYVSPAGQALVRIVRPNYVRVVLNVNGLKQNEFPMQPADLWYFRLLFPNGQIYPYEGKFYELNTHKENNVLSTFMYIDFPNPQRLLRVDSCVRIILEKKLAFSAIKEIIYPSDIALSVCSKI